MKIILFDLGNTLEHNVQNTHILMDGALDLLEAIQDMRDPNGDPPVIALVSDFDNSPTEYYNILKDFGLSSFFNPYTKKVTLSIEVGVKKPDEKIFRSAINKIQKDLPYKSVIFVTENKEHITAARKLGMMAIRLTAEGESARGEISDLVKAVPLVHLFMLIQIVT